MLLVLVGSAAEAQAPRYDVYFVAIGSGRYAAPDDQRDHGFGSLSGAASSAQQVATMLRHGAKFGVTLSSSEGRYVSRADMDSAIEKVFSRIRADHPPRPLLVIYVASHGVSEGVGWNHFSVPGDLVYRGEPQRLDLEAFSSAAIHAATLVDRLDRLGTRYLLLLDSCYEGEEQDFLSPALSAGASSQLATMAEALRHLNEFRQSDPVVFSTRPGTKVPLATDPRDETHRMAPLARRLTLLVHGKTVPTTLGELVQGLVSPKLDRATRPAVTFATPTASWAGIAIDPNGRPGILEQRSGTAISASRCCEAAVPTPAVVLHGRLAVEGTSDDWVTGGIAAELGPDLRLLSGSDLSRISVEAGEGWRVELALPEGRPIATGRHVAVRAGFEEGLRAGVALTAPGRGCNEVNGSFEVLELARSENGTMRHVRARGTQICDGAGSARFELEATAP